MISNRHSERRDSGESGIHFPQYSCGTMDSGFARFTRVPE